MARKSRKQTAAPMPAPSLYVHVALYIRLSVEDNKKRGCSVENQKLVLNDFLSDKPDFVVYDTYIDNGATGTNFHRPGFQQMLSDIEAGHITDSEIKTLFAKADEQVHVDEIRKQKTYYAMIEEMEKQRTPMMSTKNILFHQFWYMDKLFFAVYGVLICLGIIFITALQYTGLNQNGMITVCMVGAGILSITSISVIDKLFLGKMAELGESCYFNTKQCVAAWLVLSGMINVMILFLIAGYLNYHWSVGLLQVGLYILTPYLVSSITALGILSMETRGKNSSLFGMSAIFLSISYGVIGSIPRALFVTTLWIWAVAFLVSGLLFVMQIKKLLSKMEKGEVLCTN